MHACMHACMHAVFACSYARAHVCVYMCMRSGYGSCELGETVPTHRKYYAGTCVDTKYCMYVSTRGIYVSVCECMYM